MPGMKVNLSGLLKRAQEACKKADKTYGGMTAYALEELEEHIQGVCAGRYTLAEFAEHYCIETAAAKEKEGACLKKPQHVENSNL